MVSLLPTGFPCKGEEQLTQDASQLLQLTQALKLSHEMVHSVQF